jgi:hypothetical protein
VRLNSDTILPHFIINIGSTLASKGGGRYIEVLLKLGLKEATPRNQERGMSMPYTFSVTSQHDHMMLITHCLSRY